MYNDRDYIIMNVNYDETSKDPKNSLPLRILYRDLFLDNGLFHANNELNTIIDREDVTMVIVDCSLDDTDTLSIARATAFLAAYQNIPSLTARERNRIFLP